MQNAVSASGMSLLVRLSVALLTSQLAACEWTFTLRIDSARCCSSPSCELVGTCDDLFIGICFRDPNTPVEDRERCPYFVADDGSDITSRQLTPADIVTSSLNPRGLTSISAVYLGGFQLYIGILTITDIPRYSDDNIVDEMFVEIVIIPGGMEDSVMASGQNGRANITFSDISVQCVAGFGGDDCQTVNTCSDQSPLSCDEALGYCDSAGDCICYDGTTECAETQPTETQPTDANSNTSLPNAGSSTSTDPAPIIAGAVAAVVLLIIIAIFFIVVVIVCCKRKKRKKAGMIILKSTLDKTATTDSTVVPLTSTPLYAVVNKETKKRRAPPEIPKPNQESGGTGGGEGDGGTFIPPQQGGLVYADLDLTNIKKTPPPKPHQPVISFPQRLSTMYPTHTEDKSVAYSTVNDSPYSHPRVPSQPAKNYSD